MSKASSPTAERASAAVKPVSYEAALQELEQLVARMPKCEYREYLEKNVIAEARRPL